MTRKIIIELNAAGRGSVMIDGEELEGVRSVMLTGGAGQLTEVGLELIGADVLARVESRLKIRSKKDGLELDRPGKGSGNVWWYNERLADRNAVGYDPRESMV